MIHTTEKNEQKKGYTRIENELLDAMLIYPFSKRESLLVLSVMRQTAGYNKEADDLSLQQLAMLTGLHKTKCSTAIAALAADNVITREKGRFGHRLRINREFKTWKRWEQVEDQWQVVQQFRSPKEVAETAMEGCQNGNPEVAKTVTRGCQNGNPEVAKTVTRGCQNGNLAVTETVTHQKTIPINNSKKQSPPPQTPLPNEKQQAENGERGGGDDLDLIFPDGLSRTEVGSAKEMLGAVHTHRECQAILDVLAAAILAGEVRKSPLACLGGLIRRWQAGTFDPSPGFHVAEKRRRWRHNRRWTAIWTNEAVFREHARLLGVPEDEYLRSARHG